MTGPVLAMDTSGVITVGVVRGGRLLAGRQVDEDRRHAELLAPMISAVLAEAGVRPAELTAVAVGTGPAPFTGLRAGLVTARVLGFATGIPVHGVCSLDALAAEALADLEAEAAEPGEVAESRATPSVAPPVAPPGDASTSVEVLVVTDARRREVYAARYRRDGADVRCLHGPVVMAPGALAAEVGTALVVGPATRRYPEALGPERGPWAVDPVRLAALATARAARGEDQPTEPLYLRRPDVTPAPGRKRVTG